MTPADSADMDAAVLVLNRQAHENFEIARHRELHCCDDDVCVDPLPAAAIAAAMPALRALLDEVGRAARPTGTPTVRDRLAAWVALDYLLGAPGISGRSLRDIGDEAGVCYVSIHKRAVRLAHLFRRELPDGGRHE